MLLYKGCRHVSGLYEGCLGARDVFYFRVVYLPAASFGFLGFLGVEEDLRSLLE